MTRRFSLSSPPLSVEPNGRIIFQSAADTLNVYEPKNGVSKLVSDKWLAWGLGNVAATPLPNGSVLVEQMGFCWNQDCGLTFFHASQNKTAFFYVGAEGSGFSLGKKSIWLTSLNDGSLLLEAFLTQVSWLGPEVRIRSASDDLEIEWDSFPGARYQIQGAEWNDIGKPIIAGTEISKVQLARTAESPYRFFRIVYSD